MLELRRSAERGHRQRSWLDSYHSFSFSDYYDPAYMQYSVLRVINEDVIAPAKGFGMHPHRDMEIVTYMLSGDLQHTDSMGNTEIIRAGDVQRMSAGTGIVHSEVNPSPTNAAHLLQIWILPAREDITPGYEQKHFSADRKRNRWCLLVSLDGRESSLQIHQDVAIYATVLEPDHRLLYAASEARSVYVQVARGSVDLNGKTLQAGDAARLDIARQLELEASAEAEVLLFDLPGVQSPAR